MTEYDYQLAWGIYAAAALGCLLVSFYFTGWMWRYLREPLRVCIGVLLFTPTMVDPERHLYAPALAITAMDILFKLGNDALRSLADLLTYGAIAFAVYAVFVVFRLLVTRYKRRVQSAQAAQKQEPLSIIEQDATPASGLIAQR